MKNSDDFLRDIAREYAERDGAELLRERERLDRDNVQYPTSRMERSVRRVITARRRMRQVRSLAAIAACLALVLLVRFAAGPMDDKSDGSPPDLSDGAQGFEVIPLSFTLPPQFTQTAFEQDREKSIYYLDDALKDNVVMTLVNASDIPERDALTKLQIGGTDVYAASEEGYRFLTFVSDGVLYELTCQYDINTLLLLGEAIL